MPHVIIEYSDTVAMDIVSGNVLGSLHQTMIDSGLFAIEAIKTRAYAVSNFMVGDKGRDGTFVYVAVAILSGRTVEQRQTLSDNLLASIREALSHVDQVTVEIREMDKETYRKMA